MKIVTLFSDGSCLGNPGAGGWAYILRYNEAQKKASGGEAYTTNNQMELKAAIMGLKALKEPCEVRLITDSSYVVNSINEWLANWQKRNFKNVKNVELWQEYLEISKPHKVVASWVKGHAGHPENEECDQMARDEALKIKDENKFKKSELLEEALTHKSTKQALNNERLEFLGDAVMDLLVAEYLFKKFSKIAEGDMSKLRAALVNEKSFANMARRLHMGEFLRLSQAEENNGGREKDSILSDAFEAVMGAIYLEAGLDKVREISISLLELCYPQIDFAHLEKDYKTALQEVTQATLGVIPTYELIGSFGPDHKKEFEIALLLNGKEISRAVGSSKKQAQQLAAKIALEKIKK